MRSDMPRRAGFTLIELLVVVAVIALLMAILLPSLGRARERSKVVACAAQMHSIGECVQMFAQNENRQRVPFSYQQYWPQCMYGKDYMKLVDSYGLVDKLFICPAGKDKPRFGDLNTVAYCVNGWGTTTATTWGSTDQAGMRAAAVLAPERPDGTTAADIWVRFPFHTYMGDLPNPATAWGVVALNVPTLTRTPADNLPPLLADQCWGQFWSGGSKQLFNHGYRFNTDASGNQKGDCKVNVLFVDGHVEGKSPDNSPWVVTGGAFFFR